MKNTFFLLLLSALLVACNQTATTPEGPTNWWNDATLYEVNLRQMTNEGTFKAFEEQHLDRLHKMGVKILWFMPINPIGEKNRKGSLGSYYSVRDYKAVSPEHGSMDDFKALVKAAHNRGMKVIIDWVANHTAWDNVWVANHPDWFTHDSAGNFVPPVPDWHDVIDLNYDNRAMRTEMINSMKFWLTEADIDGFRCDVAEEVPIDFWKEARAALDSVKPIFFLAEGEKPFLLEAFHATYAWELHHRLKQVAQWKEPATELKAYFARHDSAYPTAGISLQFISNHDENSWNGTMTESFGRNRTNMAVASFTLPGMPLLYAGMEVDLNKRLRFFDKDTIDWEGYPLNDFYTGLVALKKNHPSLHTGPNAGQLEFHDTGNPRVLAYTRTAGPDRVHVVLNLDSVPFNANLSSPSFEGDRVPWPFLMGEMHLNGKLEAPIEPYNFLLLATPPKKE